MHTSSGSATINHRKHVEKALKLLDFVSPGKPKLGEDDPHRRLIQGCIQDLKVRTRVKLHAPVGSMHQSTTFADSFTRSTSNNPTTTEDLVLSFIALHRNGACPTGTTFSCLLTSCGASKAIDLGEQLHVLAVKIGVAESATVGTSLISFYSKCRKLESANRAFSNLPLRNTISWTSIIAANAQHSQFDDCLNLFNLMRKTSSKPNDITFASVLSTSRISIGRSFHSLELRMGLDSYTHVSNALISMYSKCGRIEEARLVFDEMPFRDRVSWNSMIFGYSQHGIAAEAMRLLHEMEKKGSAPDKVSFLGVLSSCRHAGLVRDGWDCFYSMLERGIVPALDHYSCVVDLLGRAGLLDAALNFIERMPIPPCGIIWGSLLSSCRLHGNVWMGIYAAERRVLLRPDCGATYQQLANLYASAGCWGDVARVRKLIKDAGMKPNPGFSWVEVGGKVYSFKSGDGSNIEVKGMVDILVSLVDHMQMRL